MSKRVRKVATKKELYEIIKEECILKSKVIVGLPHFKLCELKELASQLEIDIAERLKEWREAREPCAEWEPDDETKEHFKDAEKMSLFINLYKKNKDYTENIEKNKRVMSNAKGERLDANTFNDEGVIIKYKMLPEKAEEEEFLTIIKHFRIRVKNGTVGFKI